MAVVDKLGLPELRSARAGGLGVVPVREAGGLGEAAESPIRDLPAGLLFEGSAAGMALIDSRGRILFANPALQDLLGWSEEELRGRSLDSLHGGSGVASPGDRAGTRLFRRDGEPLWVRLSEVPVEDSNPERVVRILFVHDRTEEAKLAGELEAAVARFRQLADNVHDGFLLLSTDLREVIHASPCAERLLLGDVPRGPEARPTLDGVHPDDRRELLAQAAPVVRDRVDLPLRLIDEQGTIRAWLHVRLVALPDSSGRTRQVAALIEDVTGRKQVAEMLSQARKHAARLVQTVQDPQGVVGSADPRTGRTSGLGPLWSEDAGTPERRIFAARSATLTPREREVMELLVVGGSTKSIAAELSLSPKTVEVHRARVMKKMEAPSLAELVRLVVLGQVQPEG